MSAVDEAPAEGYLSIRGLRKVYPKTSKPAVDSVNMDVAQGELVALLGPSGCGKTTTLRMVAGLLEPSGGQIVVNGKDVVSTPVHKRGMGMVFQSYALFPHMSVLENVAFGLQMKKVGKAQTRAQALEALEMVKLDHLKDRRPSELSGGQQQRVALARALVIKPTLLLLDEPLSNLDAKLRESMRHEIRRIQQLSGTTTLFVTHDQDEALDMADRIAILNNGEIEQFATPTEIYERPATRFVADFVGKANFIPVSNITAVAEGSYEVRSALFGTLTVAGPPGLDGGAASLVIRPHRVQVARGTQPGAAASARGTVVGSAYTGNVVSYEVEVADGVVIRIDQLSASERPLAVSDDAVVAFDPADAYLVKDLPAEG